MIEVGGLLGSSPRQDLTGINFFAWSALRNGQGDLWMALLTEDKSITNLGFVLPFVLVKNLEEHHMQWFP